MKNVKTLSICIKENPIRVIADPDDVGAILMQKITIVRDERTRIGYYASKILSKCEICYSQKEKAALGLRFV